MYKGGPYAYSGGGASGSGFTRTRTSCCQHVTSVGQGCLTSSGVARRRCGGRVQSTRVRLLGSGLGIGKLRPSRVRHVGSRVLSTRVGTHSRLHELSRRSTGSRRGHHGRRTRRAFSHLSGRCRVRIRTTTVCRCRGEASRRRCFGRLHELRSMCCRGILGSTTVDRRGGGRMHRRVHGHGLGSTRGSTRRRGQVRHRGFSVLSSLTGNFKRAVTRFFASSRISLGSFLGGVLAVSLSTLRHVVVVTIARHAVGGVNSLNFMNMTGTTKRVTLVATTFRATGKLVSGFCANNFAPSNS